MLALQRGVPTFDTSLSLSRDLKIFAHKEKKNYYYNRHISSLMLLVGTVV